jgi:MFS family permease
VLTGAGRNARDGGRPCLGCGDVGTEGRRAGLAPGRVVADRVDRRRLLVVSATIGAALSASVAVPTALAPLSIWHLATVALCSSVVAAFFAPAESARLRQVVHADQLGSAMAAVQGRSAAATLVASALGGLLYGAGRRSRSSWAPTSCGTIPRSGRASAVTPFALQGRMN